MIWIRLCMVLYQIYVVWCALHLIPESNRSTPYQYTHYSCISSHLAWVVFMKIIHAVCYRRSLWRCIGWDFGFHWKFCWNVCFCCYKFWFHYVVFVSQNVFWSNQIHKSLLLYACNIQLHHPTQKNHVID